MISVLLGIAVTIVRMVGVVKGVCLRCHKHYGSFVHIDDQGRLRLQGEFIKCNAHKTARDHTKSSQRRGKKPSFGHSGFTQALTVPTYLVWSEPLHLTACDHGRMTGLQGGSRVSPLT